MSENNQTPQKLDYISLASVVSALAVVYLHTNECFWGFSATEKYWLSANIIESLFYFAVPIFFMISGATLLDFFDRYGLREYCLKRIKKTVVPYLFWSAVGIGFCTCYLHVVRSEDISISFVVSSLLTGNSTAVYWFFPSLFGAYLSIPLFAAVRTKQRKAVFGFLVVVGFIVNALVPFLIEVFRLPIEDHISLSAICDYSFYVVLGYLLSHYELELRHRIAIYTLGVMGVLAQAVGTQVLSFKAGMIDVTFKNYLNVPCILTSAAVFVLFRYIGPDVMAKPAIKRTVEFFRGTTFSIYLVHWYLIKIIVKEFAIDITGLAYRLIAPPLIFVFAAGLVLLLRKIPPVKKYLLPQ